LGPELSPLFLFLVEEKDKLKKPKKKKTKTKTKTKQNKYLVAIFPIFEIESPKKI
jgi:hypothetical protein